ncbi:MAG: class I SAM-dependent methyltransferase [Verrucomicrobiota bacterium]
MIPPCRAAWLPPMKSRSACSDHPAFGVRPHDDLAAFYEGREQRARFVARLFDDTARYYDRISAALSFGTCKTYRRTALRRAGLEPGMRLLDVATGTGLAAQAALDLGLPVSAVVGLDPSRGMLEQNQRQRAIPLIQGFGERLPFRDASFDFVCMGYALRHVEDLDVLFREFHRVLRPGGKVLVLEITRPDSRLARAFAAFYLQRFLPAVVRALTRNAEAGRLLEYYWATIEGCVPPEAIMTVLASSGLTSVSRHKLGGMLSEYSAMKPA